MKWENGRRSDNVEDRRSSRGTVGKVAGGAIVVAILAFVLTGDPSALLNGLLGGSGGVETTQEASSPEQDRLADMCSVVLADTEDTWHRLFAAMGLTYEEPGLVIYSGYTESACGAADSSTGPFYCSGDKKVYIDLVFYRELESRFGAPGDFAQAYVIAHEVGHHVQKLLGDLDKVHRLMASSSQEEANELSVRLELQADFYAGIWAHYADKSRGLLERGDLEEALGAAAAVGDDSIQKRSQGYVEPDTFTHGTSAQRLAAFKLGYETGDPSALTLF
ncbi:MAG: neutral zinc metallopeptidase [Spirochaetales bacterium]|nr:neutral zinc metallopeptidase [Spirochaetales bacterium]